MNETFLGKLGEASSSACRDPADFIRKADIMTGESVSCRERKEAIRVEVQQYPIKRNDSKKFDRCRYWGTVEWKAVRTPKGCLVSNLDTIRIWTIRSPVSINGNLVTNSKTHRDCLHWGSNTVMVPVKWTIDSSPFHHLLALQFKSLLQWAYGLGKWLSWLSTFYTYLWGQWRSWVLTYTPGCGGVSL